MPGNGVGDRVHNFFPQDNLPQGQHHPQIVDGNWPATNNNLWAGSPGQGGVLSSNTKGYDLQHSDIERGQSSQSLHSPHGLNFTHSTSRPDFAKNQSQSQQLSLNGDLYGNHFHQTRQNEADFLGMDTASDQHSSVSRGLSMYELHQGSAPIHQSKSMFRSETSESPVSFDLFGSQQQMNNPQLSMLHSLQQQQQQQHSGFNDMQQLQQQQQQLMLRKMQELQRQQQLQQIDARQQLHRQQQLQQLDARQQLQRHQQLRHLDARQQQSTVNPISPFGKHLSGSYPSPLSNGSPSSDPSSNPLGSEIGSMNWLQRASPAMEGSSNGLVFSSNLVQTHPSMDLGPQHSDQSLYGVPVSSSRGHVTQFSQISAEKPSMQHMATFGNSLGNQFMASAEQASMQDESLISRQRFSSENIFGHSSGQALTPAMSVENLQQVNTMQRHESPQGTRGRQELAAQQEKTSGQVATSQHEVPLDPTEERILFGSDDNIWSAFAKDPNTRGEAGGPYDSGDPNGFSSFQSGTWSALMQSAVAEASSSDMGQQEEWSGLNFQDNVIPLGNQYQSSNEKQQTSFHNDMPSLLNSSVLPPDNSSLNNNYQKVQGVHQLGNKIASGSGKRQASSSQRLIPPSEEGSRWLNSGPAELSSIHGNTSHSLGVETNIKSASSPWIAGQTGVGQHFGKPNGLKALGSPAPSGDVVASMHENEMPSPHLQVGGQKRVLHGEVVHGSALWDSRSTPASTVDAEHGKYLGGNMHMNRDDLNVRNVAGTPNSSTRFNEETSPSPFNGYQLNHWKNVNQTVKAQGSESVERSHHSFDTDDQAGHSPNRRDKLEVKMSEMENFNKENSSDSHHSNLSRQNTAGSAMQNGGLDVNDTRSLPSGKQKSVNQLGRKNSGPRKFQYHPMGNLDVEVEPSFGMKQPSQSFLMSQLSTHIGQIPKSPMELAKEQLTDQDDAEAIDDLPARGSLSGQIQDATVPFDRTEDTYTPNKDFQSSGKNMLELLHKVDQSRDHGSVMHLGSSGGNLSSEMPEAENSDGSEGRLQLSQSSASQGFGLRLGPPSHRMAVPNQPLYSQSAQRDPNILPQDPRTQVEKGQSQLADTSSVQLPANERNSEELKNNRSGLPGQLRNNVFMHKLPGNFPSECNSGFPSSRSQFQNQQARATGGQVMTNQHEASHFMQKDDSSRPSTAQNMGSNLLDAVANVQNDNLSTIEGTSQQIGINNAHARGSASQASAREPSSASSMSQQEASSKMLPNMWTNVPGQPHPLGAHFPKVSSHIPQLHKPKGLGSTSYATHKQGDQDTRMRWNVPSELGASSINKESPTHQIPIRDINIVHKMDESQGPEPVPMSISDGSPANPASVQQDLEAFGRSLKSNKFIQPSYSLLNQMRAMKSTEFDSNNRHLKKMKGPESSMEGQQEVLKDAQSSENSSVDADASAHHSAGPSLDPKLLSLSGVAANEERKISSQHGNTDMLDLGQDNSRSNPHGNNLVSVTAEHPQISPQMAPSWFSQYGSFRNGQIRGMHDVHKASIMNTVERSFTHGKSSSDFHTLNTVEQVNSAAVDTGQIGDTRPSSTSAPVPIDYLASQKSEPLKISRSKKRKRSTSQLIPWHKEVSQRNPSLQTISTAEAHWAKAANRLREKVEDEVGMNEDGSAMIRAKRRLTVTTKLMQQLFRPPKSDILSADAVSNYESVAYSVSRLALSDACSVVSHPSSDPEMPHDGVTLLSEKCEANRVADRHLLKVVESFMGRARNLENDFLRMNKRASLVDLRVECQELEKFSVINRFARFHGRGQAESGDASSSSDGAANNLKPCAQRYVTALPVPKNLPDRVQCLSL